MEDDNSWVRSYRQELASACDVIATRDQREALGLFLAHKGELAAIVLNACVPGDIPNTHSLAGTFRAGFSGPIIAASSNEAFSLEIVRAGATEWIRKSGVPSRVKEFLSGSCRRHKEAGR